VAQKAQSLTTYVAGRSCRVLQVSILRPGFAQIILPRPSPERLKLHDADFILRIVPKATLPCFLTNCGESLILTGSVSGHDFSRAVEALYRSRALAPD
jgi:hypothetical protein